MVLLYYGTKGNGRRKRWATVTSLMHGQKENASRGRMETQGYSEKTGAVGISIEQVGAGPKVKKCVRSSLDGKKVPPQINPPGLNKKRVGEGQRCRGEPPINSFRDMGLESFKS